MKKILFTIIIFLFVAVPAFALPLGWDQNTDGLTVGYVIFWSEANDPLSPVFSEKLPGLTTLTYTVSENLLKPNILYNFWVTAYDADDLMSDPSNIVTYTRTMTVVPPDNLPTEVYPTSGPDVVQGFNNL